MNTRITVEEREGDNTILELDCVGNHKGNLFRGIANKTVRRWGISTRKQKWLKIAVCGLNRII